MNSHRLFRVQGPLALLRRNAHTLTRAAEGQLRSPRPDREDLPARRVTLRFLTRLPRELGWSVRAKRFITAASSVHGLQTGFVVFSRRVDYFGLSLCLHCRIERS